MNGGPLGYLYELRATAAVLTFELLAREPNSVQPTDTEWLVAVGLDAQVNQVLQQYGDSDLAAGHQEGIIVFQNKASAATSGDPLQRHEIIKVLIKGAKHLQSIREKDAREVLGFVLL